MISPAKPSQQMEAFLCGGGADAVRFYVEMRGRVARELVHGASLSRFASDLPAAPQGDERHALELLRQLHDFVEPLRRNDGSPEA